MNRASEAKEKTEIASVDEQRKLAQAEALMNTEKTTYKGLTLPEGFAPTKIEGEDSIDEGLVITDGYGNEYVWVEVPKTTEVYPTAGLGITNFTDDEYTRIEDDLHTYASEYRDEANYSDAYAPDTTTGWFTDEKEYNNAKNKMLKSVYQNGGFWIGRYEAGIEVNRNASSNTEAIPLSKENLYPYTYVTRTQAKVLSEKIESGSCTSSLMFGLQWDLTLKYIERKDSSKKSNIEEILKIDSTEIGNYFNSNFYLKRGKFAQYSDISKWYKYDSEEKEAFVTKKKKLSQESGLNGILLTTGATDETKLQNVYDMAGNVWEWTLENTNTSGLAVNRGGDFPVEGKKYSISSRFSNFVKNEHFSTGFRVSIY